MKIYGIKLKEREDISSRGKVDKLQTIWSAHIWVYYTLACVKISVRFPRKVPTLISITSVDIQKNLDCGLVSCGVGVDQTRVGVDQIAPQNFLFSMRIFIYLYNLLHMIYKKNSFIYFSKKTKTLLINRYCMI